MRTYLYPALIAVLLAAGACKSNDSSSMDPAQQSAAAGGIPGEAASDTSAANEGSDETRTADDAAADAERVAEALQKAEADAADEARRWTDDLKARAVALRDRKFESPREALAAIVASPHRVPAHTERDTYRHPVETLTFFGITPKMTVVEVGSGAGWYTEILAPLLAREGKLVAVSYDPDGPTDSMRTVYGKRLAMFLAKSPELYGKVQVVAVNPPNRPELGAPGSADLALAIREMHNWQRRGYMDAYLAAVHQVLKDGGTFGVVQHRAPADAVTEQSAEKGYLPQKWLIDRVEAAGFELVDSSEVNANPRDTKNYDEGVWTLPPSYREGDNGRDKYAAIGESDRMTLKFIKVAGAGGPEGAEQK